jgi:hypothetical protein
LADEGSKISVTATTNLSVGGLRLKADLKAFGGPVSFTIASLESFSFHEIWDLIRNALKADPLDIDLPDIPEGPWNVFTNAELYPSIWLEPNGENGSSMHFQLSFATPIKIGGTSEIGGITVSVEPDFTVDAIMVGYNKDSGLGISAAVTMPTTKGDGAKGEVQKVVDYPFPLPAQKSSPTLQIHYLGLGQRIGPPPILNTNSEDPLTEIFDNIEKIFSMDDPEAVLTDLAQNYYDPKLGWFIAADISIKAFNIKVLFNDPSMYGLEIKVGDKPPTFLSGLRFEILYQKIGPNLGVYYAAVDLPTAMRRIPMSGFVLVLPGFSLWVYTNGDFRINVGWPVGKNSIGISWDILTGWVGFYFAKLRSGNNPGANPTVQFNPILALGIGFQLEAGVSIESGVFSASVSITVTVTMQGLLAWLDKDGNSVAKAPDAYWFAGTFEVQVLIKGAVDFAIIKASVTISFSFRAEIAVENGYGTELLINAAVTARASIKVVFFTVHFSFHTTISHKVTLTTGAAGVASVNGPQQAGLNGIISASNPKERMLTDQLNAPRKAYAEINVAARAPMMPPARLAPELRDPNIQMMRSTPVPDHVTVNVKFALQGTAIYGKTVEKNQFGTVGLLLLSGRDLNSKADADTRTDFEDLVARMVCWMLDMPAAQPQPNTAHFSDRLETLLVYLKSLDAMDFAVQVKAFFAQNVTFKVTGVDGAVEPDPEDKNKIWTVLPMFDVVTMTTNGVARDFQTYQPIPDNYAQAVDLYFDGLSLFGDKPDAGYDTRALQPEAVKTMGGFLFSDFYLMLSQHVITALHADALVFEKADKPPVDDQTELDDLLDNFDYASSSGFVSRALLGGQQLPDPALVPNPVTSGNVHNVPTGAIFALSGQQIPVAATGSVQTASATLTFSAGIVDAPTWIELVDGADNVPLTATLPLPDAVPPMPVPAWSGVGLTPDTGDVAPASDAGNIAFSVLDPLADVDMRLSTRSQSVWTDTADKKRAIVQLPTPLLALAGQQDDLTVKLAIAQDPSADTPVVAVDGQAGLIFDLPISQVSTGRPTATQDTQTSGVSANLYQVWATDDVSRERLRQVIEGSGTANISLLYLDKDGKEMCSDALDPGVLLTRTNLSTVNQAKEVSSRMRALTATPNADPAFADLDADPMGFLRLIWEVSVVNATGFYLFYRTTDGEGLPARLFAQTATVDNPDAAPDDSPDAVPIDGTNGQMATIRVLVTFDDAPVASVPLTGAANCVVADALVNKPVSIEIFTGAGAAPSWHSRLTAGELGFELEWKNQNTAEPKIGEIHPATLYQLLQFNVQNLSGETGEIWSLPLSPVQDTSSDSEGGTPDLTATAGPQYYRQAFEAYRFLDAQRATVDAENVYALAGAQVGLKYRLTDLFGNALPAQAQATATGVYHDPLFNVTQWPMVQGSHYFTPPIDSAADQALLVVCLKFDTLGLDAIAAQTVESSGANAVTQLQALARKYTLISNQLKDPGTTHELTSSLLSGGLDVAQKLTDFADRIENLIALHIKGVAFVDANGDVEPLRLSLQVPVPFSTIRTLPDNIMTVTTSITAERSAHLADALAAKLPEAVQSTADIMPRRGDAFPDYTKPRTADMLCPIEPDTDPGKSSLIVYAQNFEAAFRDFNGQGGMMKLSERAGLVADAQSDEVRTLWVVRFAGDDAAGAGIRVTYDKNQITYFAIPPLNIEPVSRDVDGVNHNGVDMDQWSRNTLGAMDQLFAPELNVAIAQLADVLGPLQDDGVVIGLTSDVLTQAKRDIAGAMSRTLQLILEPSSAGDQVGAAAQLEQAMLSRLSSAYEISTVLQAPAAVTVHDADGPVTPTGSRPPELVGRVGPPLAGTQRENAPKVYDLSGGRLNADTGNQWSTVMVTVTDQGAQRSLDLPLEFDITALQHDFEASEEFDGYTPSSWLSFVLPQDGRPEDDTARNVLNVPISVDPIEIPIPLPFEPTAPSLTKQTAIGSTMTWTPGDSLTALIEDALNWKYATGFKAPLEAQDQLFLDAIFGTGDVAVHTNGAANVNPVNFNLFDAMARFQKGWTVFASAIPFVIATAQSTTADKDARETAAKQIAAITMLAYGVSQAWLNPPREERSLDLEPEVIHYKFQMEFDRDIPGCLQMSLAGWTLDDAKQVAKPARWPTIYFTPQTGDNDLPKWEVDGVHAEQQQVSDQTWWVVKQTVDAAIVPAHFNFEWDNLKLSERQLGRLQTWVRRNADLVDKRYTSAAFIYETDAVSFASPGVPLINRENLAPVTPDAESTLYSVIVSLLSPLNFGGVELAPYIRLLGEFRYDLVTPTGGDNIPLQASFPLILQPNLELDDLDMSPKIAAKSIAAALINRRAGFIGRGGNVYLDLSITLFGSEEGQQIPLINIAPLSLDVSNVPEGWWVDA